MPRLDLDIEALKIEVLRRQQEAMRPFQEELRELEIIENLVNRGFARPTVGGGRTASIDASTRDEVDVTAFHRSVADKHERNRKSKPAKHPKPNGHHKPYATLSQRNAVEDILGKESGLDCRELVDRMQRGGYRFASTEPVQSLTTVVRMMVKDGTLKVTEPDSRKGGMLNTYALRATSEEGV